jgi:transcriptional regulator with XRE-family HTH domain
MSAEQLFGKRVRAARKGAGLTLEKAAEKLDVHLNHLSEIERGKSRPSFELIIQLAKAFGTSPMTFFMFEGEETDEKALRRKIEALLNKYSINQLVQTYRYMIFVVGP